MYKMYAILNEMDLPVPDAPAFRNCTVGKTRPTGIGIAVARFMGVSTRPSLLNHYKLGENELSHHC